MRIDYLLVLSSVLFISTLTLGQADAQPVARNAVTVETGGVMWNWYSLNYERAIIQKPGWQLLARVGGTKNGHLPRPSDDPYLPDIRELSGLTGFTFLIGNRNSHFETGILTSLTYIQNWSMFSCPMGFDFDTYDYSRGWETLKHRTSVYLGYRYQRPRGGLIISAGLSPTWQKNHHIDRYHTGETEIGRGYANKWEKFNVYPSLAVGWGF
jgi:hypothetical protein